MINEEKPNRNGFTLIELLVVIAIIAILAAILFPVFAKVREKARQAACSSNEKQLALGVIQYESDYDEMLPGLDFSPIGGGQESQGWAGRIYPYVKSTSVFTCPDDTTPPQGSMTPISYLFNPSLGDYNHKILYHVPALVAPTKTILFIEGAGEVTDVTNSNEGSSNSHSSPVFLSDYIDTFPSGGKWATGFLNGKPNSSSTDRFTSPDGRHSGGSNYILCDGHVKWMRGTTVSMGQTQGNSQCNQDGQNTPSGITGCQTDGSGYPLTGQHLGFAAGTEGNFQDGVTPVAATSSPI
jgi:prepilin-type N-terminal cleavage/methylation domain-containing protein/prepilin-type processing-associated H-X9-DG protein